MSIPKDYKFAQSHEWAKETENGTVLIGISDHAQEAMGDVAFVNLCEEGEYLSAEDNFGDIESIKAVSDIYSPVSGKVVAVNEDVLDNPDKINSDPYGAWLIELDEFDGMDALMDAEAYGAFIENE